MVNKLKILNNNNNNYNKNNAEIIKERISQIREKIKISAKKINKKSEEINLIAVTKTVPFELVNVAIDEGINFIGENKVQEFLEKREKYNINKNVKIHFIGHLQTNKVQKIIKYVDMIESVDSLKVAKKISEESKKINKITKILLEINIANEESKFGFKKEEIYKVLEEITKLENIKVEGLMCIPPAKNVEIYFKQMKVIYDEILKNIDISKKKLDNKPDEKNKNIKFLSKINMRYLSMGMSNDFEKAIFYGANIVRIGSLIFGER